MVWRLRPGGLSAVCDENAAGLTWRQEYRDLAMALEHLSGDALDLVDETVARITDAEVEEHLGRVLDQSGSRR